MLAKQNYLLPGIIKSNMHVFSQDMGEFMIESTI